MSNETPWIKFDIQNKILDILRDVKSHDPNHHFGHSFLSPYQLAIKFKELYPEVVSSLPLSIIGKEESIGGKGHGFHNSLSQYLAKQLSKVCGDAMQNGHKTGIEGAFLSRSYLKKLEYKDGGQDVESSLGQQYDLSIFRYNEKY